MACTLSGCWFGWDSHQWCDRKSWYVTCTSRTVYESAFICGAAGMLFWGSFFLFLETAIDVQMLFSFFHISQLYISDKIVVIIFDRICCYFVEIDHLLQLLRNKLRLEMDDIIMWQKVDKIELFLKLHDIIVMFDEAWLSVFGFRWVESSCSLPLL